MCFPICPQMACLRRGKITFDANLPFRKLCFWAKMFLLKGRKIMCGIYLKSMFILMKHSKNLIIMWKHILENVQFDKTHIFHVVHKSCPAAEIFSTLFGD